MTCCSLVVVKLFALPPVCVVMNRSSCRHNSVFLGLGGLRICACLPLARSRHTYHHHHRQSLLQTFSMDLIGRYSLLLASLIAGALAHSNGMDMNMDQGMDVNMGNMIMYFHFTLGDNLWFLGWAPRSTGAMVGACIGLLILAITERWLVAMWGVMEGHWRMRYVPQPAISDGYSSHVQLFTVPILRSPTSSMPLLWRRLAMNVPTRRRRMKPRRPHRLAPTYRGTKHRHSLLHTISHVVLCNSSSPASTSYSCLRSCELSRVS